jgi:hypothetical protein
MLPSISQREASSRIVAWHKQLCSLFVEETLHALVEASKAVQYFSKLMHISGSAVEVRVEIAGVVGVYVMKLSHAECQ